MRGVILLLVVMAATLVLASGVALAVGVGSAGAQGSVVGPGESIQKAVNAAHPGDTIVVRGVHREDVFIRKDGIKLRGEDAVIEAPPKAKADSPCSKFVGGPEAICVLGDFNPETDEINKRVRDVSVSGFTFRGFKDKDAFVIDVFAARNATIVGNRITGNVANGIVFGRSVNTTIAKNHVIGSDQGIAVEASSRTTVAGNNLIGNNLGMLVEKSTGTRIVSNDITDSTVLATGIVESTGTKIVSNDISRSGESGIVIFGPERANNDAKVVGNHISGGAWGMYVANTKGGL